jgi:uncharacterized coiled-coil protein SlyX
MSKERARLDMACMSQELIIIALRKQAKELERAELARCAEECEKQSEYEGGLLDRIAELEKTCKSRSDTIIEYSNKIAELQSILTLFKKDLLASCKKERDKYKAYFDSTLEKDYPANKYPRTKKPNKGM